MSVTFPNARTVAAYLILIMSNIILRPATSDELLKLRRASSGSAIGSYGCLLLTAICSLPAGYLLGYGVERLVARIGIDVGPYIRYLLPVLILVWIIYGLISFGRFAAAEAAKLKNDIKLQQIQEIHVENTLVVELESVSEKLPALCFDLGDNRLLFLWGKWLRDPETYGMTGTFQDNDEDESHVNCLRDPYGFPSTNFTIVRGINSGFILKIDIHGSYLSPAKTIKALKAEYSLRDSELLFGKIDELPRLLEAANVAGDPPRD